MDRINLLIDRSDISSARMAPATVSEPASGEVVVAIERVALTANNITYAALGDAMSYWQFFSDAGGPEGRLPSWGVGEVVASAHDEVAEGTRIFGYLPVSTHVTLTPSRVSEHGFVDVSPHRDGLAAAYQRYHMVGRKESAAALDLRAIFDPLFATSRLLAGVAEDDIHAGVQQVIITSASSKTSIGAAWVLRESDPDAAVIGLTSTGNIAFVTNLELYDEVWAYDEVGGIAPVPSTVLDLAGNAAVVDAVHARLGDATRTSWRVGATHLDQSPPAPDRPGPEQKLFFAPAVGAERAKAGTLFDDTDGVQAAFLAWVARHVAIDHRTGPDAVLDAYRTLLSTGGDPSRALVVAVHVPGS